MSDEPSKAEQALAPPRPWKKGDQGSYTMAVLEIQVCRDEYGRVFSNHQPQDLTDRETLMAWPGGGMEMISFGLLVEATRREALFGLLIEMSKDNKWLASVTASPEAKTEAIAELTKLLRVQTNRTLAKIARDIVEEAFSIVETN